MPPDETMELLGRYFASRAQDRYDRATALLATLTEQERDLARHGACNGYALGLEFGVLNPDIFRTVEFPHDSDIVNGAAARLPEPLTAAQATPSWIGPRNYWLFREAAVMGFVLGDQHGGVFGRAARASQLQLAATPTNVPAAEEVLLLVVKHCQSTSDKFPILGNDPDELAWNIMRWQNGKPLARGRLAAAVRTLMPTVTAAQVDEIVNAYIADERFAETPDGIQITAGDEG